MKFFHIFTLLLVALAAAFSIAGCDEGMNMVKPVMMEDPEVPVEQPTEPEEQESENLEIPAQNPEIPEPEIPEEPGVNPGTMGEIKQDEDELEAIFLSVDVWKSENRHGQVVQKNPNDFVGFVCTAYECLLADATVTIMAGPRAGERVNTNKNGQYTFPNYEGNEVHVLVKKEYFEPKEVIVYRDRQTTLANGDKPNFLRRPKTPGRIQIGQRWPDEIRPILKTTLVVHDLLMYYTTDIAAAGSYTGSFGHIMVGVDIARKHDNPMDVLLSTVAHEVAHAHQQALLSVDGSISNPDLWDNTPEGKAFAEAREKDWEEVGKFLEIDLSPHYLWLTENAAEVCVYFWITYQKRKSYVNLEVNAPHRLAWAVEWFGEN